MMLCTQYSPTFLASLFLLVVSISFFHQEKYNEKCICLIAMSLTSFFVAHLVYVLNLHNLLLVSQLSRRVFSSAYLFSMVFICFFNHSALKLAQFVSLRHD